MSNSAAHLHKHHKQHDRDYPPSVTLAGTGALPPSVPQPVSRWHAWVDSLPVFGTTDAEKRDTGQRLNPFTRLGARIALPVMGLILNELATSKYNMAIDFLKHYMYGRGELYKLEAPADWQKAISSRYQRPGFYHNVSSYNWNMKDIQNALGHFDLKIVRNNNQTLTYYITDEYKFPAPTSQRERHGFPIPGLADDRAHTIQKHLLPSDIYTTKQGFKEKWELRKLNGEWILFIPQPFLDDYGVNFPVKGEFTISAPLTGKQPQ